MDDSRIVEGYSDPEEPDTVGRLELVESDKQLIRESDTILVCYEKVLSVGAPMEVIWAHEPGYPIAIWLTDETSYDSVSAWYHAHVSRVAHDVRRCFSRLEHVLAHLPYIPGRPPNPQQAP